MTAVGQQQPLKSLSPERLESATSSHSGVHTLALLRRSFEYYAHHSQPQVIGTSYYLKRF